MKRHLIRREHDAEQADDADDREPQDDLNRDTPNELSERDRRLARSGDPQEMRQEGLPSPKRRCNVQVKEDDPATTTVAVR